MPRLLTKHARKALRGRVWEEEGMCPAGPVLLWVRPTRKLGARASALCLGPSPHRRRALSSCHSVRIWGLSASRQGGPHCSEHLADTVEDSPSLAREPALGADPCPLPPPGFRSPRHGVPSASLAKPVTRAQLMSKGTAGYRFSGPLPCPRRGLQKGRLRGSPLARSPRSGELRDLPRARDTQPPAGGWLSACASRALSRAAGHSAAGPQGTSRAPCVSQ